MALRARILNASLVLLAACNREAPAPVVAAAAPVEGTPPVAPPATPPIAAPADPVAVAKPADPPPAPPGPATPEAALPPDPSSLLPAPTAVLQALHPVTIDFDNATLGALPSGHVLVHDGRQFAVFTVGVAGERVELHDVPAAVLAEPEPGAEMDEGMTSLEALHGLWPDAFYATLETGGGRVQTNRYSELWQDGGWRSIEDVDTGEAPYSLSMTFERFTPWVKGRALVQRGLTCTQSCPEEDYETGEWSAEARKAERRLDRQLARHKPLAVMGGRATAVPVLPDGAELATLMSLPTGDLYVARSSGPVDRWNLTQKTWQSHALAPGGATLLAGTRAGDAYVSRCGPPSVFALLQAGEVVPLELPAVGCVTRLIVDRDDALWIAVAEASTGKPGEARPISSLWRRRPDAAWERIELPRVNMPVREPRWLSDDSSWTLDTPPSGDFAVQPVQLEVFGPGDVWISGILVGTDGVTVLLRDRPGPPPHDFHADQQPPEQTEGDDGGPCDAYHLELGNLSAGTSPLAAWPAAVATLASVREQDYAPRLFEVGDDEDSERSFYAMVDNTGDDRKAVLEALRVRLAVDLPGVGALECGVSPRPTREHPLPTPAVAPAPASAPASAPAP